MDVFTSAADLLRNHRPERPVLCLRPHAAARAARWFLANFPGQVLYAAKANDTPAILDALVVAGIRAFDVASLVEIERVAKIPAAELYFMNPVKSRGAIVRGYRDFGVRSFAFDSDEELDKRLADWQQPPAKFGRGYGALYLQHITQADQGCDFDFLEAGPPTPEPEIH